MFVVIALASNHSFVFLGSACKNALFHTSESSRKIRKRTLSVRLESCGHLIKSMKLKMCPFPCEMAPVICVLRKWYVSS